MSGPKVSKNFVSEVRSVHARAVVRCWRNGASHRVVGGQGWRRTARDGRWRSEINGAHGARGERDDLMVWARGW